MTQPKKILIAADLVENNAEICAGAIKFAQAMNAEVTLVHAIEYIPYYPYYPYNEEKFLQDCQDGINKRMNTLKEIFLKENLTVAENIIEQGKAYEVICKAADNIGAEAIVVGVGEHFLFEKLIGSTTEKVSRLAKQPVLILTPTDQVKFEHILCAYDFSENSKEALTKAVRLAKKFNAKLDIVHVVEKEYDCPVVESKSLQSARDILNEMSIIDEQIDAVDINSVILKGKKPEVEMANYAREKEVDLIIVGSNGHSAISRLFLGSTSANLLRNAPCHIMVSKPQ